MQDVTSRTQLLVREEIELAKAEVTDKATKLAKGAVVGAAAGIFVITALLFLLHGLAWFLWKVVADSVQNVFLGYLLTALLLLILAAIAGLVAKRLIKKGSPPKPAMAIEEAQRIKSTVQNPPGPPAQPRRAA
jgi:hypothetical protein